MRHAIWMKVRYSINYSGSFMVIVILFCSLSFILFVYRCLFVIFVVFFFVFSVIPRFVFNLLYFLCMSDCFVC